MIMQPTTPTACFIVLELSFGIKMPVIENPINCLLDTTQYYSRTNDEKQEKLELVN
jgi:hypothetical protein